MFVFRIEEPDSIAASPTPAKAIPAAQIRAPAPSAAPVAFAPVTISQPSQPVAQQSPSVAQPQPFVSPRGVIPVCAACIQTPQILNVTAVGTTTTQTRVEAAPSAQVNPQVQLAAGMPEVVRSSQAVIAPVPSNGIALVVQEGIPPTQFTDSQGRVPTIYRLDMGDPGAFLVAQGFMVKNKDVLYVANASSAEFTKFLGIMVQVMYPLVNGKAIGL